MGGNVVLGDAVLSCLLDDVVDPLNNKPSIRSCTPSCCNSNVLTVISADIWPS